MIIHLLTEKPQRFGEIKRAMHPISQKVLTEQLRELEATNIVTRDVFEERVLNVTYSLSALGKTLSPVLDAIYNWGETNLPLHGQSS